MEPITAPIITPVLLLDCAFGCTVTVTGKDGQRS